MKVRVPSDKSCSAIICPLVKEYTDLWECFNGRCEHVKEFESNPGTEMITLECKCDGFIECGSNKDYEFKEKKRKKKVVPISDEEYYVLKKEALQLFELDFTGKIPYTRRHEEIRNICERAGRGEELQKAKNDLRDAIRNSLSMCFGFGDSIKLKHVDGEQ